MDAFFIPVEDWYPKVAVSHLFAEFGFMKILFQWSLTIFLDVKNI